MNLKYFSPMVCTRKFIYLCNNYFLHYLDPIIAKLYPSELQYPPIFIIGAPRSGSTLLFQVLTDAFDVAYMSNLHCQFFGAPALAERIFRTLSTKKPSDFSSVHGRTNGLAEPSECGEWWYRFFRREPAHVTLSEVSEAKMRAFRRSLAAFASEAGRPLVFKNLYATLRLEPISKYVPEALFIVIRREELYNAASILAGRKRVFGTYEQWWSVPPPDVEELKKKPVCQQVLGQIRSIYREIERVIEEKYINPDKFLWLEYEKLCQDSTSILQQVEDFLRKHHVSVNRRFDVPRTFQIARNMDIDPALQTELHMLLRTKDATRR